MRLRLLDAKVTFQEALSNMEAKLEAATAASAAAARSSLVCLLLLGISCRGQ